MLDAFIDRYYFQRTPRASQISEYACPHFLISWLSYNNDVLYLSFQVGNCYVTSIEIEIESKAYILRSWRRNEDVSASRGRYWFMKQLALITDGLSVTAKPLNDDIEHNWVSTVVASRPTFYIWHKVASFLYKGKPKNK